MVYRGSKPVVEAEEKDSVRLVVENPGDRLSEITLLFGESIVHMWPELPAGAKEEVEYHLPGFVGENIFSLNDEDGAIIAMAPLFVSPSIISLEEFKEIKHKRLPELMEILQADNIMDYMDIGGSKTLDATLMHFPMDELIDRSTTLLELSGELYNLMTYHIKELRRNYKGMIKGTVNWRKTMILRANKGTAYEIVHHCQQRKRAFDTQPNLLMVRFHLELYKEGLYIFETLDRREREKIAWRKIWGLEERAYNVHIRELIDKLGMRLNLHKEFLMSKKIKALVKPATRARVFDKTFLREVEEECRDARNREYRKLRPMWEDWILNYTPRVDRDEVVQTQRIQDVYQIWCVCEMARSLGMLSEGRSLRQFNDREGTMQLFCDDLTNVKRSWSRGIYDLLESDGVSKIPVKQPGILLRTEKADVLIITLYELDDTNSLPKSAIQRLLAEMNEYDVQAGIMFYPGTEFRMVHDDTDRQSGKLVIKAPMLPKISQSEDGYDHNIIQDYLSSLVDKIVEYTDALEKGVDISDNIKAFSKRVYINYLKNLTETGQVVTA